MGTCGAPGQQWSKLVHVRHRVDFIARRCRHEERVLRVQSGF